MLEFQAPPGAFKFLAERQTDPKKFGGMNMYEGAWFTFPDQGISIGIYPLKSSELIKKTVTLTEGHALNRTDIEGITTLVRVGDDDLIGSEADNLWQREGIDRGCCSVQYRGTGKELLQEEVTRVLDRIMTILAEPIS